MIRDWPEGPFSTNLFWDRAIEAGRAWGAVHQGLAINVPAYDYAHPDDLTQAVRDRDVERSLARYAPDVLAFDLVEPLRHEGSDSLRSRLRDWFSSFDGPIGYELSDLDVTAGDDVAPARAPAVAHERAGGQRRVQLLARHHLAARQGIHERR